MRVFGAEIWRAVVVVVRRRAVVTVEEWQSMPSHVAGDVVVDVAGHRTGDCTVFCDLAQHTRAIASAGQTPVTSQRQPTCSQGLSLPAHNVRHTRATQARDEDERWSLLFQMMEVEMRGPEQKAEQEEESEGDAGDRALASPSACLFSAPSSRPWSSKEEVVQS